MVVDLEEVNTVVDLMEVTMDDPMYSILKQKFS